MQYGNEGLARHDRNRCDNCFRSTLGVHAQHDTRHRPAVPDGRADCRRSRAVQRRPARRQRPVPAVHGRAAARTRRSAQFGGGDPGIGADHVRRSGSRRGRARCSATRAVLLLAVVRARRRAVRRAAPRIRRVLDHAAGYVNRFDEVDRQRAARVVRQRVLHRHRGARPARQSAVVSGHVLRGRQRVGHARASSIRRGSSAVLGFGGSIVSPSVRSGSISGTGSTAWTTAGVRRPNGSAFQARTALLTLEYSMTCDSFARRRSRSLLVAASAGTASAAGGTRSSAYINSEGSCRQAPGPRASRGAFNKEVGRVSRSSCSG